MDFTSPWFGKFLTNGNFHKGKYAMILVMASTLAFTWFGTGNDYNGVAGLLR